VVILPDGFAECTSLKFRYNPFHFANTWLHTGIMNSENSMLSNLETLITSKLEAFEKRITENQQFSQQQLSSIQENLNNNDSYLFRKKGNEEKHKANGKALRRMKEADGFLRDALASVSADDLSAAQRTVAEGIDILEQKLIKLVDSSDSGWRVVREYEAHPLADDSEDEKKIHRAQVADRQERRTGSQRYSLYPSVTAGQSSVATSGVFASSAGSSLPSTRRLGLCFRCGRPGHWRKECRAVLPENGSATAGKQNKISTSNTLLFESLPDSSYTHSSSVVSPVGKLELGPFCHGAHKLDLSTLFTAFFL